MLGVDFITKTVLHNAGNMRITDKKDYLLKDYIGRNNSLVQDKADSVAKSWKPENQSHAASHCLIVSSIQER